MNMGMSNTATTNTTPARFVVGSTYSTGEANDYTWRFRVIKRTAKFITVQDVTHGAGDTIRVGVSAGWQGHEIALPLGRYSMAPVISADDVLEAVTS